MEAHGTPEADDPADLKRDILLLQGQAYLATRQFEAAEERFSAVLAQAPETAGALIGKAHLSHRNGASAEAAGFIDRALAAEPDNIAAWAIKGAQLRAGGQPREAVAAFDRALAIDPAYLPALLSRATAFLALREPDRALWDLAAVKQLYPQLPQTDYLTALARHQQQPGRPIDDHSQNPDLLNALATSLLQLEAYDKAERVLNDLMAIAPGYFGGRYNLAQLRYIRGEAEEAKEILESLLSLEPANEEVRILLARAHLSLSESSEAIRVLSEGPARNDQRVKSREMLVILLKNSGQYERALVEIDRLLATNRLNSGYLQEKAEIYIALREYGEANQILDLLYGVWRDQPTQLVNLARIQRRARNLDGARKSIDRALAMAPDARPINLVDIELSIAERNQQAARAKLEDLRDPTSDTNGLDLLEAELLLAEGKPEQAQEKYAGAFARNMGNGLVLVKMYNLALMGYGEERFETQARTAIAAQPGNPYYRNLLADYLLLRKRNEEAREHYLVLRRATNFPNRAAMLNNLAISSVEADPALAYEAAKAAVELKPDSASMLDTYGWVLANQARYEEALEVLRRAHSLLANDPSIQYHLGYTLYRLGRREDGVREIRRAVDSGQRFLDQERAIAFLQSATAD
jgi:tetratricopeptide (TPR) repeat protein